MKVLAYCVSCVAWLTLSPALAQEMRQSDAQEWLLRMANAARQLNYAGTYVYQSGPRMETTRVTHLQDAQGELEKLEMLDGPPREIIRDNETVHCYFPNDRVVRLERSRARRYFPALIGDAAHALSANYTAQVGPIERVAGYDCRVVVLRPKDKLRFGHRLCAEVKSGLLLKAAIVNEEDRPVDQVAFTTLEIGVQINRDALRSAYAGEPPGWKTDSSSWEWRASEGTWYVREAPAGFKKVMEMQRRMQGRADPVTQLVFSDGMAAISIFIEASKAPMVVRGPRQRGVVSVYTRQVGDHQITALGEVPTASLQRIVEAVGARK